MPKFLMDADTAGDDVTSMLFALRWPGFELEAITVVAGNIHLDQAVANTLYTVEIAGRNDVPVYAGADKPLLRDLVTAYYVHGADGMGNSNFPVATKTAERMHAVDAIVDSATTWSGELEIIAQAPLTNIALALMKDPELPTKVKRLWIMGGTNNSLGNITPAAEFNFYVDPEAAHMVLGAGFNVVLLPWDVCVKDGILLRDELTPIIDMKSELAQFYLSANRAAWNFVKTEYGIDGITHPDSLMTTMAIDESVITQRGSYFVDVEYEGAHTRGYSVVDVMGVLARPADEPLATHPATPNADVVLRANKRRFRDMLIELLRDVR